MSLRRASVASEVRPALRAEPLSLAEREGVVLVLAGVLDARVEAAEGAELEELLDPEEELLEDVDGRLELGELTCLVVDILWGPPDREGFLTPL